MFLKLKRKLKPNAITASERGTLNEYSDHTSLLQKILYVADVLIMLWDRLNPSDAVKNCLDVIGRPAEF